GSQTVVTCFSISLIVSSETDAFDFLASLIALVLTFLRDSLALLVNCLASLARCSRCSLVTLSSITYLGIGTLITVPSTSGFRFIPLSLMAIEADSVLDIFTKISSGDFIDICPIWFKGNFPSFVTTTIWSRAPRKMLMGNPDSPQLTTREIIFTVVYTFDPSTVDSM
uniref:Uncharacterized protein n=1 Tax=Erpetoichthys calabaricus TaxID=27687 RepID=A0A8C4SPK3_ERPCA